MACCHDATTAAALQTHTIAALGGSHCFFLLMQRHCPPALSSMVVSAHRALLLAPQVDVAVWQPDWPALLADLQAALPQYSMRIVSGSRGGGLP